MPKPPTTKTLGPLHFEDLEPHRFEDLVRQLVYDYKDWQTIEATGRSGSDEGWDIRAYERSPAVASETADDEEVETAPPPMEGNAWMVQVKREKALGPADVKRIIAEVDSQNPPYGYILAAPTNFSKKSYDAFRAELRAKGVREFYVWGRAELEDMLQLPKNDRILFTFFGISLVSRRRSRTTEVRAAIVIKNKLYRVVGEGVDLHKDVLVRDLADTHYPFDNEYPDFENHPRWRQMEVKGHHPLGLRLRSRLYYAYVDRTNKEFDFTTAVDLCDNQRNEHKSIKELEDFRKKHDPVRDAWELLPKARQAMFIVDRFLPYARIAAIDEKGDVLYECPHIFVDFGDRGPFEGNWEVLEIRGERVPLENDFKRVKKFPQAFNMEMEPLRPIRMSLALDAQTLATIESYQDLGVLFATDKRYKDLQAGDVVTLKDAQPKFGGEPPLLQITYVGHSTVGEYLSEADDAWKQQPVIQTQVGSVTDEAMLTYVEYRRYYRKQTRGPGAPPEVAPEE
jgi:Restriction endonuclease